MRGTAIGFVALSALTGGVLWWGFSRSQAPVNPIAPLNESAAFLQNEQNTVDIVSRYGDGVVFVSVSSAPNRQNFQDPFGFFFQQPPRQGTGSGFVLDTEGFILTNYHVVDNANRITIRFHNDPREYPATVVGTAAPLDLALLKVDAPQEKLKPLPLGDSTAVRVGQKAIAMGNPFGLEFTVTEGIVSAVRRNPNLVGDAVGLQSLIQTDAAINPGNSGGPLLNSRGQVIGINTAIISPSASFSGEAQNSGVGFAVPINTAKQFLPDMRAGKNLSSRDVRSQIPADVPPELANRPRIGVTIADLTSYPERVRLRYNLPAQGVMITDVQANSPAARAGLRGANQTVLLYDQNGQEVELAVDGDIVLEADGQAISSSQQLTQLIASKSSGQSVNLRIQRGTQQLQVQVTPEVIR